MVVTRPVYPRLPRQGQDEALEARIDECLVSPRRLMHETLMHGVVLNSATVIPDPYCRYRYGVRWELEKPGPSRWLFLGNFRNPEAAEQWRSAMLNWTVPAKHTVTVCYQLEAVMALIYTAHDAMPRELRTAFPEIAEVHASLAELAERVRQTIARLEGEIEDE